MEIQAKTIEVGKLRNIFFTQPLMFPTFPTMYKVEQQLGSG